MLNSIEEIAQFCRKIFYCNYDHLMFGIFKKKETKKQPPQLFDINGLELEEGDIVTCHRYELGQCKVVLEGLQFFYEPENGKERVSYVKMVDAITGYQKVTKKETQDS